MIELKIAFRNVLRNRRRSMITALTTALGACGVLLLGALMSDIILDFQTSTVRRTGHLEIFRKGYFEFGSGNPAAYGIVDYQALMDRITADPALAAQVVVVTPTQALFGIAGNFDADTSRTFIGQGIVPADRARMRHWDDYGLYPPSRPGPLSLTTPNAGVIGVGLARILRVCGQAASQDCAVQATPRPVAAKAGTDLPPALAELGRDEAARGGGTMPSGHPRIDLMTATAGGAPNVVSMEVMRSESQGIKDLDDASVIMQLPLAQQLLYGRGKPAVTGIMLQLRHTSSIGEVRERLRAMIRAGGLDLEVRDFTELTPLYRQAQAFLAFVFTFVALIIGVVAMFTILNTMTMSVMERTSEIGTVRSLGAQRASVRLQFTLEGALLGTAGATAGLAAAVVAVFFLNHSGLRWTPPAAANEIPLHLYLGGNLWLVGGTWLVLALVATVASLVPAHRAARMNIVDALRHV